MTFIQIRFISLNSYLNFFFIKTECIQIIILLQQIRFIPLMTITFFFLITGCLQIMTFTSTNWIHTTDDHNFFFSRNWLPSNNDLYFNKLIGFIYTTNDHNFFVSRNWMPSKLIMTFKRASWTQYKS